MVHLWSVNEALIGRAWRDRRRPKALDICSRPHELLICCDIPRFVATSLCAYYNAFLPLMVASREFHEMPGGSLGAASLWKELVYFCDYDGY